MLDLPFVLVVASSYEVEVDSSPRAVHLVFVMGAKVIVFTRHQPLGGVCGAVRPTHDSHVLDALAHRRASDTAMSEKGGRVGYGRYEAR